MALALPWLESLAPRSARGQAAELPKRFVPIYYPNGVAPNFWPTTAGSGDAFQLNGVLEPFAPIKDQLSLFYNVENYSCRTPTDLGTSGYHGRACGTFLTCVDAKVVREALMVADANGVSVDQVLAAARDSASPLPSLQLGLSTWQSYCDGDPCSLSRCLSWSTPTKPLAKLVQPQAVFDLLFKTMGHAPTGEQDLDKSVLDAVLASSQGLDKKLSQADRKTLDQYLTSVRGVESRLQAAGCPWPARPTFAVTLPQRDSQQGYDRSAHFDIMNDLLVLALQCDVTRVVSFMLEDERSEFIFDQLPVRTFTATSSAPNTTGEMCTEWHGGGQSGDGRVLATLNWWHNAKVAALCQKLAALSEGATSVLDNTVIFYSSSMDGPNHSTAHLPVMLLGGKNLIRGNQFVKLTQEVPQRDVFYTLLTRVFGVDVPSFGVSVLGAPNRVVPEILRA